MSMPDSTAPTSRSRSKVSAELSKYEMEQKSASFQISIRMRDIDGKKELLGMCNDYSLVAGGIPTEYSSKEKFKEYVNAKIDAIYEALQ